MLTARPCGLDLRNLHPVIRDSGTRGPSPNNGLSVSEHGGRLSVRRLGELNVHPEAGALGRLPGLLSQGWACPLLQGLPWGRGQNSCNARKGRGLQGGGSLFPGRPWGLLVRGALVLGPPLRLNWRVREEREGRLGGEGRSRGEQLGGGRTRKERSGRGLSGKPDFPGAASESTLCLFSKWGSHRSSVTWEQKCGLSGSRRAVLGGGGGTPKSNLLSSGGNMSVRTSHAGASREGPASWGRG